jgi:uncharacterized protein (UPF0262 family)
MPRSPRDNSEDTGRLAAVTLDEASLGRANDDVEHERRVAIYDLIEANTFRVVDHSGGPYTLQLGISGNRLVFDIRLTDGTPVIAHMLSLSSKIILPFATAITRRSAPRRRTASRRSIWAGADCTTRARAW